MIERFNIELFMVGNISNSFLISACITNNKSLAKKMLVRESLTVRFIETQRKKVSSYFPISYVIKAILQHPNCVKIKSYCKNELNSFDSFI